MEKQGPFYYFMMEKKPEVQKQLGRFLPMCELAKQVSADWQAMSESEKARYRGMKSHHGREKLDCYGIPLRVREEEAQKKKREAWDMQKNIEEVVDMYHSFRGLGSLPFYVISGSFYLRTDEGVYMPAEISLLRFSFNTGIIKEFHAIMEPFIPVAYRRLAMEHSQATHNLLPKDGGEVKHRIEKDAMSREQVAHGIEEFLHEDCVKYTPLYTLHSELEQMKEIMQSVTGEKGLKIYSLDMLFQHIFSVLVRRIPLCVSTDILTQCSWEFHVGIACWWHTCNERDSVRHCTMSCVKRWVFLMCHYIGMVPTFRVVPEKGKHCPVEEPVAGTVVNLTLMMQEKLSVSDYMSVNESVSAGTLTSPCNEAIQESSHHQLASPAGRSSVVFGRGQAEDRFSAPGPIPGKLSVSDEMRVEGCGAASLTPSRVKARWGPCDYHGKRQASRALAVHSRCQEMVRFSSPILYPELKDQERDSSWDINSKDCCFSDQDTLLEN